MDYTQAITLYTETFNEGPPIFGMEEDEAIEKMKQAIDTGEKMTEGAEINAPKGALI